jgi:hypothetical protein
MRNIVPALCALLACACSSGGTEVAQVTVSGLNVGLMREDSDGEWRVYLPGDSFPLVPNGPCVVAEKVQTCMWYGFEFDFSSNVPDQLLMCEARFNKPTDMVTADRIESTDVADATFTIPLRGRKGHYSQAAHVFRNPDDAPTPWSAAISCKHNAKELIRFTFTALYEA